MSQNGAPSISLRFQRLGAWLAALALVVQVFIVQPHIDVAVAAQPPAHAEAHISAPTDHSQASCIICHAFAVGGFATLTNAPTLSLVSHAMLDVTPAVAAAAARAFPAHPWHSRGPPSV
ncbi:MAG: hypothetical protein NW206_00445 [Hyphomonadaceae bacterium]|nr:hypothetical protein [Hyphomonadaceae bacterium]